jgi:hypothetical protein
MRSGKFEASLSINVASYGTILKRNLATSLERLGGRILEGVLQILRRAAMR